MTWQEKYSDCEIPNEVREPYSLICSAGKASRQQDRGNTHSGRTHIYCILPLLPWVLLLSSSFALAQTGQQWPTMASATTYELRPDTVDAIAAGRVRFVEHEGRRILFINYSHCDVALLKAVAEECHRVIAREPADSVLTLNDVTGTTFDKESVAVLQAKVAANAPHVRRAAVIGISGLQRLIYESVQAFSKRRIPHFETRQEALNWLVND